MASPQEEDDEGNESTNNNTTTTSSDNTTTLQLVHHGSAATSSSKVLTWLPTDYDSYHYCEEDKEGVVPEKKKKNDDHNTATTTTTTSTTTTTATLVYASHSIINLVRPVDVQLNDSSSSSSSNNNNDDEKNSNNRVVVPVWNTQETLRTELSYSTSPTEKAPTITALTLVRYYNYNSNMGETSSSSSSTKLACGFSNGSINIWNYSNNKKEQQQQQHWKETVLLDALSKNKGGGGSGDQTTTTTTPRSITDLNGIQWNYCTDNQQGQQQQRQQQQETLVLLVSCSSSGVNCHYYHYYDCNPSSTIASADREETTSGLKEDDDDNNNDAVVHHRVLTHHTASAVQFVYLSETTMLLLIGTAAPRHNKIQIYSVTLSSSPSQSPQQQQQQQPIFTSCGSLTGHEDWITCFAWQQQQHHQQQEGEAALNNNNNNQYKYMLASGSQDFKIRLWQFTTSSSSSSTATQKGLNSNVVAGSEDGNNCINSDSDNEEDDVDDNDNNAVEEEDYEEHESRMELMWHKKKKKSPPAGQEDHTQKQEQEQQYQTSVSLEALLLGHEGPVTAVQWYPSSSSSSTTSQQQQQQLNNILLSSSMDRSILLWSPSTEDGIWTPISRVGSAGGILGGSIGSTLLGYLNVLISPTPSSNGDSDNNNAVVVPQWLIGHAYGGSLHIWKNNNNNNNNNNNTSSSVQQQWKATPCVTGHFDGVTDLCWESTFGDYLLTVSGDQTCRLWGPVPTTTTPAADNESYRRRPGRREVWMELARPQVHGYSLSSVTSLSSPRHRHWIVSGADEKELRILDAPLTTIRVLNATQGGQKDQETNKENVAAERVERAYIPSLGLSNKATAAEGAEEDVQDDDNDKTRSGRAAAVELPYERDLGALSLWLESRKMFGHNTEIYRVTSTLEAKTAATSADGSEEDAANDTSILVASTAKARDVDAAAIRIWNPHNGECLQTLSGGHKATVATLSFSPDGGGRYLASSGKDRRLCIWRKTKKKKVGQQQGGGDDGKAAFYYYLAAAKDSAHKRIIWSVHFCPYDPTVLASGSRDGNIKIWRLVEENDDGGDGASNTNVAMETMFSFAPSTLNRVSNKPDSVTALAFAPMPLPVNNINKEEGTKERGSSSSFALLALGLECGVIELWSISLLHGRGDDDAAADTTVAPRLLHAFPNELCHVATVTKLAWRPLRRCQHASDSSSNKDDVGKVLTLASASSDHGCRIYEVDVTNLYLSS